MQDWLQWLRETLDKNLQALKNAPPVQAHNHHHDATHSHS